MDLSCRAGPYFETVILALRLVLAELGRSMPAFDLAFYRYWWGRPRRRVCLGHKATLARRQQNVWDRREELRTIRGMTHLRLEALDGGAADSSFKASALQGVFVLTILDNHTLTSVEQLAGVAKGAQFWVIDRGFRRRPCR